MNRFMATSSTTEGARALINCTLEQVASRMALFKSPASFSMRAPGLHVALTALLISAQLPPDVPCAECDAGDRCEGCDHGSRLGASSQVVNGDQVLHRGSIRISIMEPPYTATAITKCHGISNFLKIARQMGAMVKITTNPLTPAEGKDGGNQGQAHKHPELCVLSACLL